MVNVIERKGIADYPGKSARHDILGKFAQDFIGLLSLEHHHIRLVAVGNLHGDHHSLQIG